MNITEIIQPIYLKSGHHPDTAQTGSGCFMDVASYLNGDAVITDRSSCVHPEIRNFIIPINDQFVPLGYGPRLLPFVARAMGTAGMDRADLRDSFSRFAGEIDPVISLHSLPMESFSVLVADVVIDSFLTYAEAGMPFAWVEEFLDEILPPADAPTQQMIDRAQKLVAVSEA